MAAQFCIREGGIAHVQVGGPNGYEKFDVPATDALVAHFNRALEEGETSNSFYGSSTQYAPVEVQTKRRFVVRVVTDHVLYED